MRRLLLFTLLITLFTLQLPQADARQSDGPSPASWHGMVLDESTPDDALKAFGKAARDSTGPFNASILNDRITRRRKEKIFRTLEFKKPAGVERAWLTFLDGKLVSITLDLKSGTVSPNALSNIYGTEFHPIFSGLDLAFNPRDFERHESKVYPKNYPTVYHLASVTERSFVLAMIGNQPGFGRLMGVPDKPDSFPGKVEFVQLISRKLENRDGADVLK